jgi:hypothetical protein
VKSKSKRKIVLKNRNLQKIRYALRMVIIRWAHSIESGLGEKWKEIWWDCNGRQRDPSFAEREHAQVIQAEKQKISRALDKSICICPVCGSAKKDMIFNPKLSIWFCIDCYDNNKRYYKRTIEKDLFP